VDEQRNRQQIDRACLAEGLKQWIEQGSGTVGNISRSLYIHLSAYIEPDESKRWWQKWWHGFLWWIAGGTEIDRAIFDTACDLISELWLRQVSKQDFITEWNLDKLTLTPEDQARRRWIEHGKMNGNNQQVMRSLAQVLPPKTWAQRCVACKYMTELWLRDVTREEFVTEIGETETGNNLPTRH
jgi:hypothetical protein